MKRRARRVVLLAALGTVALGFQAQPASAGELCTIARAWFNYSPLPLGGCLTTGGSTLICDAKDVTWSGVGAGYTACVSTLI